MTISVSGTNGGPFQVYIYNAMGEIVATENSPGTAVKLNTRKWANGIYAVTVRYKGQLLTRKVLVTH